MPPLLFRPRRLRDPSRVFTIATDFGVASLWGEREYAMVPRPEYSAERWWAHQVYCSKACTYVHCDDVRCVRELQLDATVDWFVHKLHLNDVEQAGVIRIVLNVCDTVTGTPLQQYTAGVPVQPGWEWHRPEETRQAIYKCLQRGFALLLDPFRATHVVVDDFGPPRGYCKHACSECETRP